MLRNTQKEIERDSSLTGDVYMMKAKLRSLQEQLENSDNKISALRNEVSMQRIHNWRAHRRIFHDINKNAVLLTDKLSWFHS